MANAAGLRAAGEPSAASEMRTRHESELGAVTAHVCDPSLGVAAKRVSQGPRTPARDSSTRSGPMFGLALQRKSSGTPTVKCSPPAGASSTIRSGGAPLLVSVMRSRTWPVVPTASSVRRSPFTCRRVKCGTARARAVWKQVVPTERVPPPPPVTT